MSQERISRDLALERIRHHIRENPPKPKEVTLSESFGLICARDLFAAHNAPAEPRSTVDGYALSSLDTRQASAQEPAQLLVSGQIRPSTPAPGKPILTGHAVGILTGGPLPPGADCVVTSESVEVLGNGLRIDNRAALHNFEGLQPVGTRVALDVRRDGKPLQLNVALKEGARSADGASLDPRLAGATLKEMDESARQAESQAKAQQVTAHGAFRRHPGQQEMAALALEAGGQLLQATHAGGIHFLDAAEIENDPAGRGLLHRLLHTVCRAEKETALQFHESDLPAMGLQPVHVGGAAHPQGMALAAAADAAHHRPAVVAHEEHHGGQHADGHRP